MNNMNKQCFALASWQPDSSNSFQHSTQTSNLSGLTKWSYLISFISHGISWQPRQRDTKIKVHLPKCLTVAMLPPRPKDDQLVRPKPGGYAAMWYPPKAVSASKLISLISGNKKGSESIQPGCYQTLLSTHSCTTAPPRQVIYDSLIVFYITDPMDLHTWLLMPFLNSQFGS